MRQEVLLTYQGETHNLSGWAKKLELSISSISERRIKFGNDLEKVLCPSKKGHGRSWTQEEDEYLEANAFTPNLHQRWGRKASVMGWNKRSHSAIQSRIFILQQRGKFPAIRGNTSEALSSGWVNLQIMADNLGVHPHTVKNFTANGLDAKRCQTSGQTKINLKKFVQWATKPQGAALVAKAIKNDPLALGWLLVEIGNWSN